MTLLLNNGKWTILCCNKRMTTKAFELFCDHKDCSDCLDKLLKNDKDSVPYFSSHEMIRTVLNNQADVISGEAILLVNEEIAS